MREENENNMDFSTVALQHLDALFSYAMVLTREQAAAEDLVQETYLRAVRAFANLIPDSNLKGWMFTILRNIWLNQCRYSRNQPHFVDLDEELSDHQAWFSNCTDDPYVLLVKKLEREEVRAAIARLPAHYKEVVLLRDIEGFSYQQIGNILNCPIGTVMSRLGRAREQLRFLLSQGRVQTA